MASDGVYSVTLDEAIEAMRLTAADMSVKYKETSLSVSLNRFNPIVVQLTSFDFLGTCCEFLNPWTAFLVSQVFSDHR